MAAVNTIDKFGRQRSVLNKSIVVRGPPGIGFNITADNHFDIQNKRLKNIGEPADNQDGVTRNYVDKNIGKCMKDIKESHMAFMENQWSDYSKFIYNKITVMIDEVRQYIHKEISEVKKLTEDNYSILHAAISKVNHTVQEYRMDNTSSAKPQPLDLTKVQVEEANRQVKAELHDIVAVAAATLKKKPEKFRADRVTINT